MPEKNTPSHVIDDPHGYLKPPRAEPPHPDDLFRPPWVRRSRARARLDAYASNEEISTSATRLPGDQLNEAWAVEVVDRAVAGPAYDVTVEGRITVESGDPERRARIDQLLLDLGELGFHPQRFYHADADFETPRRNRRWSVKRVPLEAIEIAVARNPGILAEELAELVYRSEPWTDPARANALAKLRVALCRLRDAGRSLTERFDAEGRCRYYVAGSVTRLGRSRLDPVPPPAPRMSDVEEAIDAMLISLREFLTDRGAEIDVNELRDAVRAAARAGDAAASAPVPAVPPNRPLIPPPELRVPTDFQPAPLRSELDDAPMR